MYSLGFPVVLVIYICLASVGEGVAFRAGHGTLSFHNRAQKSLKFLR